MSPVQAVSRLRPVIKVAGTELSAAHSGALLDVRVESGVRSIGRAVLRLADPGYEISADGSFAVLGAAVTIADAAGGAYFDGEVAERAVSHTEADGTVFEIVALDRAHRLSTATVVEARQQQTLSDAIGSLVSAAGLRAQVSPAPGVLEWTAVAGTALSVIDEVAERYGLDWIARGTTFHVWSAADGSPGSAAPVRLGLSRELSDFAVRVAGGHDRGVTVRGWDPAQQKAVVGTAQPQPDRSSTRFLPSARQPASVQRSDLTPVDGADADRLAKAASAGARAIARGRGPINPAIAPGATVSVADAGVSSGSYYVREVEHVFTVSGGWTRFVAGDRDAPRLADPWDGRRETSTFTHHGALIGVVTQVHESDPCVRVKLPVIGDQFESNWARVLMLGAGDATGLFVMPEIHDEVLVVLPDGDLRQPIVVGGLHSKLRAPTTRATTRDASVAKTPVEARAWASKQQHYIELADGSRPERQHVKLGLGNSDQYIRVGKDRVEVSAPANVPIRIGSTDASIEFGTDGSITLRGKKIVVEAQNAAEITAQTAKVAARTEVAIEGQTKATLKGGAQTAVESQGTAVVKGAMVQIN